MDEHNSGVKLTVRIDSAGYNHRIMKYCDERDHEFVITGGKYEIILDMISALDEGKWEKLRDSVMEEEGFAVGNILAENFLPNATFFQMKLLAFNLVQYILNTQTSKEVGGL